MRIPARIQNGQIAISEAADNIRVHAPAPHRPVRIVLLSSVAALAGKLAWHLIWLFLSETSDRGLAYPFCAVPLILLAYVCVLSAYNELATANLTFERNTIELERRLLGIRMSRRWFALADIRIFGPTLDTRHSSAPGYLYLRLRDGKIVALLQAVDPVSVARLCAALERRGWQYGDELPDG